MHYQVEMLVPSIVNLFQMLTDSIIQDQQDVFIIHTTTLPGMS